MTTLRLMAAAFAISLLSLFSFSAANAADYGPPAFSADVPDNIEPGGEFTITFESAVSCAWTLDEFEGQSAPPGSGKTYTVTLTAPTEEGTYTVTANCTWDPEVESALGSADAGAVVPAVYSAASSTDNLLAVPQTDQYSVEIVVGDASSGSGDGDGLPDTGGSSAKLLLIGGGLVVAGAGVTVAARRRKTAA